MNRGHGQAPARLLSAVELAGVPGAVNGTRPRSARTKKLLSIEEAAEYTGFTVRYLRRLIFERRIAYHKDRKRVWLSREDLDAYVHALRVQPLSDDGRLPTRR